MHRIVGYSDSTIKEYNKSFNDIAENIRDFVFLHYITDRKDTPFWQSTQILEVPDSLHTKLEQWKTKIPVKEDFNTYSDYILFTDHNFIVVMDGLNLFDRTAIAKEYASLSSNVRAFAEDRVTQKLYEDANLKTITHKEYLRLVREMF
jgi:tryptophan halogenase